MKTRDTLKHYQPVLDILQKQPTNIKLYVEADSVKLNKFKKSLSMEWFKTCREARGNIRKITESFMDALDRLKPDTKGDLIELMAKTMLEQNQKRLKGVLFYAHICFIYDLELDEEAIDKSIGFIGNMFILNEHGCFLGCYMKSHEDESGKSIKFLSQSIVNEKKDLKTSPLAGKEDEERLLMTMFSTLLVQLAFIKYAPIETKILKPNERATTLHCKYINETKSPIEILDCTWFTNLVKSEGFNVNGHMRMQPCGKGRKDRVMIWINEYKKKGYTRLAKRPMTADETAQKEITHEEAEK